MRNKTHPLVAAILAVTVGLTVTNGAQADPATANDEVATQFAQTEPTRDRTSFMTTDPSADDMKAALSTSPPSPLQVSRLSTMAIDVKFAFDSPELTPSAKEMLTRLATAMSSTELDTFFFLIEGHTDSVGRDDYNLDLSWRRARAVREFLVNQAGIRPERLLIDGKGETDLLDPTNPSSQVNRRVEVVNAGRFN